ncbi:MAG TPA: glycosyltransferase family 4 protein [Armatimonadota bacterium]|nr:glycosyltransferase family 4 protein [Propioniciclava tarda]HOS93355.1 glycosyltransferase family 4 protein [Armatimonadota bacterium]
MPGKRRVLVINHYAFPREYGGLTRNFDMFSRLKNWQFRIIATSRNHYTGEVMVVKDPRWTLLSIPSYSGNGSRRILGWILFAIKATLKALRTRADVYFGSSPHPLAAAGAMVVAAVRRRPFVLEVRDLWPESIVTGGTLRAGSGVHTALVWLERLLYRRAAKIVVVTKGWENHFESLGIDIGKVTVISNGADLADYDVPDSKDALRQRYGISGFTAVFTGNHSPYVGLELILDAAAALPDVNFVCVGNGSRKAWAISESANRGLTNVEFRDPIGKPELPWLLKACDVGLHTISPQSVFDKGMSPNKLFDYMASGIPIVSNARIPLRDVVKDDQAGPVVEPDELAQGIARVRDADPQTRVRWSQEGRRIMEDRFSLRAAAARLEAVLDSV